jgi:serine protease
MRSCLVPLSLACLVACTSVATDGDGRPAQGRRDPAPARMWAVSREEIAPGRVLVEFARPVALPPDEAGDRPMLAPLAWTLGGVPLHLVRTLFDGELPLALFDTGAADEAETRAQLARIAADPLVRRAEADRVRRIMAMPNDPQLPAQWALKQIRMAEAWDRTRGSADVVVAILDTGILKDHPDLRGRLLPGHDFVADPENAGDGGGRDADPTDTGGPDPGSSNLHGTHVAGIIGAETHNGRGVAGMDWACRLVPVRVLGIRRGTGVDSDIADALRWAAGLPVPGAPRNPRPAHVINMSFGGLGISFTVQRAVDEVIAAGALVVAAAGNSGGEAANFSPGGLDQVITVGAARPDGTRAAYSNHGERVDLLAPGGDDEGSGSGLNPGGILSTYRDLGSKEAQGPYSYFTLEGTSQAAPHVSGAVALARSLAAVRQNTMAALLRSSADRSKRCDLDEFAGCGAGLLNVPNLLTMASLQPKCGCKGDLLCLDGRCIDPGFPHRSVFADPVLRGGCSMAGRGGGGPGLALLLIAALIASAARRAGSRAGSS